MLTLSIDRSELGLLPLSIVDTLATGTAGIALMSFNAGQSQADNAIAMSRWLDGGSLVSRTRGIVTLEATFRVEGSSLANLVTRIDELTAALDQFSYTITETPLGGSPVVHTCMPANFGRAYSADLMRHSIDLLNCSIPRQP